jgi:hypothetical protein
VSHRTTRILLAGAAAAALALPASAQARQGADDPPGHVRQESRQTTVQASTEQVHRNRGRHRRRHGGRVGVDNSANRVRVDDGATVARGIDDNTARHGGADDGPNHT